MYSIARANRAMSNEGLPPIEIEVMANVPTAPSINAKPVSRSRSVSGVVMPQSSSFCGCRLARDTM